MIRVGVLEDLFGGLNGRVFKTLPGYFFCRAHELEDSGKCLGAGGGGLIDVKFM